VRSGPGTGTSDSRSGIPLPLVALLALGAGALAAVLVADSPVTRLVLGLLAGWLVFIWLNHFVGRTTLAELMRRRR
jgi:hypothetical protein